MVKNVKIIPSTVPPRAIGAVLTGAKRRVAAYTRVSTDSDEQFTSYEAQIDYYTHYIQSRPDWTFVSVYSDEGITGCNTNKRKGFKRMVSGVHPFSGVVYCGDCSSAFGSKVWHANDKYRRVVWQCNRKYQNKEKICTTPHVTDSELKAIVVSAMRKLRDDRETVISAASLIRDTVYDTSGLTLKAEQLRLELAAVSDQLSQAVLRNASVALDLTEHKRNMDRLTQQYQELQDRHHTLRQEILDKDNRRNGLDHFIQELKGMPDGIVEFDPIAFRVLVERVTVYSGKRVIVRFRDGTEIPC